MAAISASDISTSAPPLAGSKSSWLNPIARLPRACKVWWARSWEKPPARRVASTPSK